MLLPEILNRICVLLSRRDLKNARLVSYLLDDAAQPLLFATIFLRIHLQSFERLQDIARHKRLRKHVRFISYDGRTLSGRAASQGLEEWLRFDAGAGLGLAWKAKDDLLSQFSNQQLEQRYFNYCQYLFSQEYILKRSNEKDILLGALQNLPGLAGFEYVVPEHGRMSSKAPQLSSLSPVAQDILAEPEALHGYLASEGHFWTLLQSACLSHHQRQLRRIHGSDLDLGRWNTAGTKALYNCYQALPNLQHLSLEFEFAQHIDGETTVLFDITTRIPALESLRLSFDEFSWDNPSAVIHLPQVIDLTIEWKYLRNLSLQAIVTTEEALQSLLRRHAQPLRSLELSNITFKADIISHHKTYGSWIRFIQFLSQTLSLEHVRFNGCFFNEWDEAWVTRDADYNPDFSTATISPYSNNCLKFRIERFITCEGICPFTRKEKGSDVCYDYHDLPWEFDEDRSWRFEPRLF